MNSFDEWFDNKSVRDMLIHSLYSAPFDRLSQDRCIAEQAYKAGMERAADMLELNYPLCAKWIRKEIT